MNDQPTNQPDEPREQPPIGMRPEGTPSPYQPTRPEEMHGPAPLEPLVAPTGMPDPGKARPKRRKGIVIAIIIAIVVVLGASAAAAYKFWYQNPNKVIGDALMNAAQAKTVKFSGVMTGSGDVTGSVTVNGATTRGAGMLDFSADFKKDGTQIKLTGGGIYDDKGDLYLKLGNIDELIKSQTGPVDMSATMQKIMNDFIAKVDDKWIKVSADELKNFSPEMAKTQKCIQDATKKLQDDKAVTDEIVELYKKYPFLIVKKELGSKDGSLGYEMGEDTGKFKEFTKGLKDTIYFKTLHECDSSITFDDTSTDKPSSDREERIEIWVSRWSHEFTKMTVVTDESKPDKKATFTFEPTFNEDVTVTAPSESKNLKELGEDFQAFQMEIMTEQMQSQGMQMPTGSSSLSSQL